MQNNYGTLTCHNGYREFATYFLFDGGKCGLISGWTKITDVEKRSSFLTGYFV